jgi:hypothetical protein
MSIGQMDELLALLHTVEFEDNGDMRIVHAHWSGDRLVLRAQVDHGDETRSSWQLRFTGVLESSLTVLVQCGLNIWQDHAAIDQYTRRRQFLHFSAAPTNPDAVVGQLWAAHSDLAGDWIPFERYLNGELPLAKLLASGSGLLATGPDFLISAYAAVLERNGCRPSTRVLPKGRQLTTVSMAHFGESFVIAESIAARRIGA